MKTMFLCGLVLLGVVSAPAAVSFTVNDGFAGTGTLELSESLSGAEVFTWMGQVTWDSAPFSGTGQFADGTPWSGGRVDHSHFASDTGAPSFINFVHYDIGVSLTGGSDSVSEHLGYDVFSSGGPVDVTITDNGITFAGIGAPPGDDSDGDLAYLLDQSAHFPASAVPEPRASAFTAVVCVLLLFRGAYQNRKTPSSARPP